MEDNAYFCHQDDLKSRWQAKDNSIKISLFLRLTAIGFINDREIKQICQTVKKDTLAFDVYRIMALPFLKHYAIEYLLFMET